eukprot:CAMPEP_0168616120 /NCGR_PEP_ID=MMETSP0449_2-20121227/4866_1 /TAXON_ID=1082188 /ORGANISM="Strombidium rassoulzadegani, Strain ras09" /LENGTH=44 /DNA_ID= /DNA_START= /DNA_END= /DNA_ORIENTATION=
MISNKMLMQNMSKKCFTKCIIDFDRENLNHIEKNCLDRCINKYS